jgi:serine protease
VPIQIAPVTNPAAAVGALGNSHVLKPRQVGALPVAGGATPLLYHGGAVQTSPSVVVGFWGSTFQTGFKAYGVTNTEYVSYVLSTLASFGGGSYIGSQSQYCQGVSPGTVNCNGLGTGIGNPFGQLVGSWTLMDNPPTSPSDLDIALAAERVRAAQFGGNRNDSNANIMIFTLPDHNTPNFGSAFCGWHSFYFSPATFSNVHYTNMPFIPQAFGACGRNSVNATDDAFGHGALDGVSVVALHEQAEVITSPNIDGWYDGSSGQTIETGDKCAWTNLTNVSIGGNFEAVQPLWSNRDNACVHNQFPALSL